jgi:hypothetical protein
MLDFVGSQGLPESALWCAVLWRAWEDLQHHNGRIKQDACAFFAGRNFDRVASLALLNAGIAAIIREAAQQRAAGEETPVSRFSRKPIHTYQRRSQYLIRLLEHQGEVRPLQEWCKRLGLNPITVYVRLHRGWTVAEALTGRRESPPEMAVKSCTLPLEPCGGAGR